MDTAVEVFLIVAGAIFAAATGYRAWLDYKSVDIDGKLLLVEELVQAAEQWLGERGEQLPPAKRYAWVVEQFQHRFPSVDANDLKVWIEAAVHRMNERKPTVLTVGGETNIDDGGGSYWMGARKN